MSKLFEDFFSRKWNLYGLQLLAGSLMVMILHQYLTIFELCVIGLCTFIISFCQRLLGIKFGMLFYEANEDRLGGLLNEIRKLNEKEKEDADK